MPDLRGSWIARALDGLRREPPASVWRTSAEVSLLLCDDAPDPRAEPGLARQGQGDQRAVLSSRRPTRLEKPAMLGDIAIA